ncbi:hypothetical protein [Celeribacter halophilus]|uniref:hypothetical protein n=1 Tax=Celeribacter halophilus TaxID=576117 RepID=UPI003A8D042B
MSKKLIVFGNGLGRALDNDYFNLESAMKHIWESDWLKPEEKALIATLDGFDALNGPSGEEDLISAYGAQLSINLLKSCLEKGQLEGWMTSEGQSFSKVLEKYTYAVAYYFHLFKPDEQQQKIWAEFCCALIDHIAVEHSHIATLNYDTLLYDPFLNTKSSITGEPLCSDELKTTKLFDGFGNRGMFYPDRFGWYLSYPRGTYMHLHGTPLFHYDHEGRPQKRKRSALPLPETVTSSHQIILGPSDLKRQLIRTHPVLKDYWEKRLPKCITDSEDIILFGYGGADPHLNELIKDKTDTKKKYVIEWSGEKGDRKTFWEERLGPSCEVVPMVNILNFRLWDDPAIHNIPF